MAVSSSRVKVVINSIQGRDDFHHESVWMRVVGDTNLKNYFLVQGSVTQAGKTIYGGSICFTFPSKVVRKGDWIILYTRAGSDTSVLNKKKTFTHHFYWGLEEHIWDNPRSSAMLVYSPVTQVKT